MKAAFLQTFPVKEKKLKVKKRFFNYLVFVTKDGKTILEERKGKGIWQGLYQFPLIETENPIASNEFAESEVFLQKVPEGSKIQLYNQNLIIHKLSHQHLHTRFWVIYTESVEDSNVNWSEINRHAVPVLISNFLEQFNPKLH